MPQSTTAATVPSVWHCETERRAPIPLDSGTPGRLISGRLEPGTAEPTTPRHEQTHGHPCRRFSRVRHRSSGSAALAFLMENLGRGVVAVRSTATEVFVGWRVLGHRPAGRRLQPLPLDRRRRGRPPQRRAHDRPDALRGRHGGPDAVQRLLRAADRVRHRAAAERRRSRCRRARPCSRTCACPFRCPRAARRRRRERTPTAPTTRASATSTATANTS